MFQIMPSRESKKLARRFGCRKCEAVFSSHLTKVFVEMLSVVKGLVVTFRTPQLEKAILFGQDAHGSNVMCKAAIGTCRTLLWPQQLTIVGVRMWNLDYPLVHTI